MDIQEIAFSLEDNAQYYTGNTVEVNVNTDANQLAPIGWNTSGSSNRSAKGILAGSSQQTVLFRSQNINGRIVFWSQFNQPPIGKSNWAVMQAGTTFDHIWSSWRGQRWVEEVEEVVVNIDEGQLSFQDLWDFHQSEVFNGVTILPANSEPSWIDENTMDISNMQIAFGLNKGFSMNLTYKGDEVLMRSGGDKGSFSNSTITMNWVQYTDDEGDVIVHSGEGDIVSEDALIYDADTVYAGTETVEVWEYDFILPTVETDAKDETGRANYEGMQTLEIKYTPDNIETGESEERWVVYHNGRLVGAYSTQLEASESFEQQKQQILDNAAIVDEKQSEANTQVETDKAVRQKFGLGEFKKIDLPDDFGSMVLGVGMIGIALFLIVKLMSKKSTGEGSSE